jgi:DNA-binding transcriptional regulator GbsR (MarR family)
MKFDEAKSQFIQTWGALGSQWGINKTMAQIHALLLISEKPLCTEDVMEDLGVSRGNVNMNTRALIDWGLVEKAYKMGDRKEYFTAEKDMWKVAARIAAERRKRELAPVLKVLEQVKQVDQGSGNPEAVAEFQKTVKNLEQFSIKADKLFDKVTRADEHWFTGSLMKLVR